MAIYHEDIVDIDLSNGTISRSFLNHTIGSGDESANRFGVMVYRNGSYVDISGCSCQAVFMNSAGEKIALTSYGTVNGNKAYVTLPQACYNVEGQFCLAIKLIGGGITGTMRIVDGVVCNTGTVGTIAPTESVPTYQEVLAVYSEVIEAAASLDSMQDALGYTGVQYLEGKGQTLSEKTFPNVYISGQTILLTIKDWNTEGITQSNEHTQIEVGYLLNDVYNIIVSEKTNVPLKNNYVIEFPNNIENAVMYVRGRIATGETGVFEIRNKNNIVYDFMPDFSLFIQEADFQYIRMSGVRSTKGGYIDEIIFKIKNAGTVTIYLLRGQTVLYKFTKTVGAGIVRLRNGVDFVYTAMTEPNLRIGIAGESTNRMYFYTDGTPSNQSTYTSANVGDDLTIGSGNGYNISIGFTIRVPEEYENEIRESNRNNRGPQTAKLVQNEYYFSDSILVSAIFSAGAGDISLYISGYKDYDACGSLMSIGLTGEWKIKLAKGVNESTVANPEYYIEENISVPWVDGREYYIELYHNRTLTRARIVDTFTKQEHVISNSTLATGEGRGKIGYIKTDNIKLRNFMATTKEPFDAKMLVIGDSYSAGATMFANMDKRWFELYATETGAKVFNNSKGGLATYTGANLLGTPIQTAVHPEYVMIELGVNDNSLNNYKGNIMTIVDWVENVLGATPVIFTIPPTQNSQSALIYGDINTWVKTSGIRYIDMCKALTVNGAGTTRNDDLFFSDNVHPNVAGHAAIYAQMKVDVPEMFAGI